MGVYRPVHYQLYPVGRDIKKNRGRNRAYSSVPALERGLFEEKDY
jgi:hypothetical protein